MNSFGMPGPGGSLGECALCGKSFVNEILLGKTVRSFMMNGIEQRLFGHDDCLEKYNDKEISDFPPESAIRIAFERSKA